MRGGAAGEAFVGEAADGVVALDHARGALVHGGGLVALARGAEGVARVERGAGALVAGELARGLREQARGLLVEFLLLGDEAQRGGGATGELAVIGLQQRAQPAVGLLRAVQGVGREARDQ